jgi:hypothetical protein
LVLTAAREWVRHRSLAVAGQVFNHLAWEVAVCSVDAEPEMVTVWKTTAIQELPWQVIATGLVMDLLVDVAILAAEPAVNCACHAAYVV